MWWKFMIHWRINGLLHPILRPKGTWLRFGLQMEFSMLAVGMKVRMGSHSPLGSIDNNSLFSMDANGTLRTATTFDYESIHSQAKGVSAVEGNFISLKLKMQRMQALWRNKVAITGQIPKDGRRKRFRMPIPIRSTPPRIATSPRPLFSASQPHLNTSSALQHSLK